MEKRVTAVALFMTVSVICFLCSNICSASDASAESNGGVKKLDTFLGIENVELDGMGFGHIWTADGTKWAVLEDKERDAPFFMNTKSFALAYEDPRAEALPPYVEGVKVDSEGLVHILTEAGEKWIVARDADKQPFFVNAETNVSQWNDPRDDPAAEEEASPAAEEWEAEEFKTDDGARWWIYQDDDGKTYYVNDKTKAAQWDDPRVPKALQEEDDGDDEYMDPDDIEEEEEEDEYADPSDKDEL